ncbi:CobW family GTP-binding protein [Hydrogenophaga sp. BPS33]|uniref:CobW family GTP-binding protein n=1 Tax=Hydrogenophaga sp. BPS33 TaxID=2651974 RepID=UPI00132022E7|nr:GTP-binding protein [Hydrogenophaga sp. BPS33]QHE84577.1 GTP-binding protein [Hydrogenophaga sp. BPS33]
MKATRIPVWLMTGYLGSGKTTLLRSWLRDAALQDAALIVNEIGEVGLDDSLLGQAVDSASLISSACICCTGLPGLQEALSDLWWDRLHRRRPTYSSVVIESTGLADPRPVVAAFDTVPLLRERYQLAGVFTAVSAVAGLDLIEAHPEAVAQVGAADALIVTKCDRADGAAVERALHSLNPRAAIALSRNASLDWRSALAMVTAQPHTPTPRWLAHMPPDHGTSAHFVPLDAPLTLAALHTQVDALQGGSLLRLKGVIRLDDGALREVQWSMGDLGIAVLPFTGHAPKLGLTCIRQDSAQVASATRGLFVV